MYFMGSSRHESGGHGQSRLSSGRTVRFGPSCDSARSRRCQRPGIGRAREMGAHWGHESCTGPRSGRPCSGKYMTDSEQFGMEALPVAGQNLTLISSDSESVTESPRLGRALARTVTEDEPVGDSKDLPPGPRLRPLGPRWKTILDTTSSEENCRITCHCGLFPGLWPEKQTLIPPILF
jgi:hypothetical protein